MSLIGEYRYKVYERSKRQWDMWVAQSQGITGNWEACRVVSILSTRAFCLFVVEIGVGQEKEKEKEEGG